VPASRWSVLRYGLMSTPGVVIDGKVVHAGGIPSRDKIAQWLSSATRRNQLRLQDFTQDHHLGERRELGADSPDEQGETRATFRPETESGRTKLTALLGGSERCTSPSLKMTVANCCEDKSCEVTALRESHGRVLWIVLTINALMFLVEGWAGLLAHSTSLLADALDMLGDALVYGFSLFVLARNSRWQAGAALAKGAFMLAFGLGVLAEATYKAFHPVMPGVETMGVIGGIALAANLVCFFLLYRHRDDNLNMSSTWLCSRNDLIANVGVLLAAGGSYLLVSRWPDIVVGAIIASLFLSSALRVLSQATKALRTRPAAAVSIVKPVDVRTFKITSH
jgi:Co/Zn/Cd efflux system component